MTKRSEPKRRRISPAGAARRGGVTTFARGEEKAPALIFLISLPAGSPGRLIAVGRSGFGCIDCIKRSHFPGSQGSARRGTLSGGKVMDGKAAGMGVRVYRSRSSKGEGVGPPRGGRRRGVCGDIIAGRIKDGNSHGGTWGRSEERKSRRFSEGSTKGLAS